MTNFENNAIEITVNAVATELGCDPIDAVSKMQATCARKGNDEMLEKLCEYKTLLIEALCNGAT